MDSRIEAAAKAAYIEGGYVQWDVQTDKVKAYWEQIVKAALSTLPAQGEVTEEEAREVLRGIHQIPPSIEQTKVFDKLTVLNAINSLNRLLKGRGQSAQPQQPEHPSKNVLNCVCHLHPLMQSAQPQQPEPRGTENLYVTKAAYEALKAQTIQLFEHERLLAEAEQKAYERVSEWLKGVSWYGAAKSVRTHFCKPKECVMVQPCGAPFEAGLSVDGVEVARFSKASDADEYAALLRARLSKEGNRG